RSWGSSASAARSLSLSMIFVMYAIGGPWPCSFGSPIRHGHHRLAYLTASLQPERGRGLHGTLGTAVKRGGAGSGRRFQLPSRRGGQITAVARPAIAMASTGPNMRESSLPL